MFVVSASVPTLVQTLKDWQATSHYCAVSIRIVDRHIGLDQWDWFLKHLVQGTAGLSIPVQNAARHYMLDSRGYC